MVIMVNGDHGDNGDNGGNGDGDGSAVGGRQSAIGDRRSGLVSWLVVVVGRSSLVARFDSCSLDARRRSADSNHRVGVQHCGIYCSSAESIVSLLKQS